MQKELATAPHINVPMYSRIECGKRQTKRNQVETIACIQNTNKDELIDLWLADKVYSVITNVLPIIYKYCSKIIVIL